MEATVDPITEELGGYRVGLFDCPWMKIRSRTEWLLPNKKAGENIKNNGGNKWTFSGRVGGVYHKADLPSVCVHTTRESALVQVGLNTLTDIWALHNDRNSIKDVLAMMPLTTRKRPQRVVGETQLKTLIKTCVDVILLDGDGEPPQGIDYIQEEDPYKAGYGESWEIEIRNLKCHKSQCCVTDLIELMMTEGEKLFKGTKREKNGISTTIYWAWWLRRDAWHGWRQRKQWSWYITSVGCYHNWGWMTILATTVAG